MLKHVKHKIINKTLYNYFLGQEGDGVSLQNRTNEEFDYNGNIQFKFCGGYGSISLLSFEIVQGFFILFMYIHTEKNVSVGERKIMIRNIRAKWTIFKFFFHHLQWQLWASCYSMLGLFFLCVKWINDNSSFRVAKINK